MSAHSRPSYCFLDLDINGWRSKLATAAAFVNATDTRYGFSSKDIRKLGGSELSRVADLIQHDHEWSSKAAQVHLDADSVRPPPYGGRIVVKLFWDVAPLACENFCKLCCHFCMMVEQDDKSKKKKVPPAPIGECGKPLIYKGSVIHRVIPGFVMQGGDFVFGNGSGGESALGKRTFKDERAGLLLKHSGRGTLGMGNSGKNSNSSQFYITFGETTPQCDGKHVVFGQVVSGFTVIDVVEKLGTSEGTPTERIEIKDCGIYIPDSSPGAGYWLDVPNNPEQAETSFLESTPVFMARPRVAVMAPTQSAISKFTSALLTYTFCEITVTVDERGGGLLHQAGRKVSKVENVATIVHNLLNDFVVDVVVVAPACQSYAPKSTKVIVVKPADCLAGIHSSMSWVAQQGWTLDGAIS